MCIGLLGLGFGVQVLGFEFSGGKKCRVWVLGALAVQGFGRWGFIGVWFMVLRFRVSPWGGGADMTSNNRVREKYPTPKRSICEDLLRFRSPETRR